MQFSSADGFIDEGGTTGVDDLLELRMSKEENQARIGYHAIFDHQVTQPAVSQTEVMSCPDEHGFSLFATRHSISRAWNDEL